MTTYEVELEVTQRLTFLIEDAAGPDEAIRAASQSYWEGDTSDDSGCPSIEVCRVKAGEQEIDVMQHIDWGGPKDDRGVSRWKVVASGGAPRRELATGYDTGEVVRRAFAAIAPGGDV